MIQNAKQLLIRNKLFYSFSLFIIGVFFSAILVGFIDSLLAQSTLKTGTKPDTSFTATAVPYSDYIAFDSLFVTGQLERLIAKDTSKTEEEIFVDNEEISAEQFADRLEHLRDLYDFVSNSTYSHQSIRDSLILSVSIISEMMETEGVEEDFEFSRVAYFLLQSYYERVKKLEFLDSDNPVLSIHEKLFGTPNNEINVDEKLFQGIFLPKTKIPITLNAEVKRFIIYFSTVHRKHFERYLSRASYYFPTVGKYIKEVGAPQELLYLSLVESGVNPHAKSRASAVGMWQFMKGTGRLYGLSGNQWFDERRNLEKSTRASAKHLIDLYNIYDDWYLALAAYNAGPGKINRAIKRAKEKNFWAIKKYIRRETREYVPRFIAASIIALNPERFGFQPMNYAEPMKYDEVEVNACLSFEVISTFTGISVDSLEFFNPELTKKMTPPALKGYKLKVPFGKGKEAKEMIAAIPETERSYHIPFKAKREESIKTIAKKYGVSVPYLMSFNSLKTDKIKKGAVIMIPANEITFTSLNVTPKDLSDDSRERRSTRRYRKRKTRTTKTSPSVIKKVSLR
ncbi:MAG: transglycosylase SLT domain-containing protein [Chloroherpetonaceae bacterium]|nr:transglycosylase SLT domain-containing protein [Chloroherpetonaceae bacterium]